MPIYYYFFFLSLECPCRVLNRTLLFVSLTFGCWSSSPSPIYKLPVVLVLVLRASLKGFALLEINHGKVGLHSLVSSYTSKFIHLMTRLLTLMIFHFLQHIVRIACLLAYNDLQ